MLDKVIKNDNRVSIYQPEQPGLIFPERPTFETFEAEREYRKQHLVAAVRAFAMHGFDYGFAGHLTVRDPERPELYWTNPMCIHFSQVKMSNLVLADHTGNVVEGTHAINRAGFVLHSAVHEAYPDIIAMCHAHTVYGTAWCSTGKPLTWSVRMRRASMAITLSSAHLREQSRWKATAACRLPRKSERTGQFSIRTTAC